VIPLIQVKYHNESEGQGRKMKRKDLTGKVQTVLGIVDANSLGTTMVHEHLLHDMEIHFIESDVAGQRSLAHQPVGIDNLWWVRINESKNIDNLKLIDEGLAIKEAMLYNLASGKTLVEVTPPGIYGRDPLGLVHIANATNLNIIMGSGYYAGPSRTPQTSVKTDQEFTDEIIQDIMVGVGHTGVHAGIIGEIHCSASLDETDRNILRCCAIAQQRTGAPLSIHPSPSDNLVMEIMEILRDSGAELRHTIIGHVDLSGFSRNTCHKLAEAGCFLAYDNFGLEGLLQLPGLGRDVELNDRQRISDILSLISDGYADHILVSQDLATKHRLTGYGGLGYAHILRDIMPLMRSRGLTDEQEDKLLVENPKRVLSFFSPDS
jgi:phosphotriesterase-related protein